MKKLLIALLMICLLLSVAAVAETYAMIDGVTADRVHLRAQPSTSAASLGLYYTSTPVVVLSAPQNGWAAVQIGAEYGYVRAAYLADGVQESTAHRYEVANPNSTWVYLRSAPSTSAAPIATLTNGRMVDVMGETASGWSYVDSPNGFGYIMTKLLTPVAHPSETEAAGMLSIIGRTADGDYILQYIADNGQALAFTAVEPEPYIIRQDVNFDGAPDLVVRVSSGASNAFFEFFVSVNGRYVQASHDGLGYGLCNYTLYPALNIVVSDANNGNAGALREICLFRWNGTSLELLRRGVSDHLTETAFYQDTHITTVHTNMIHAEVRDFPVGTYEGRVIWERTQSQDDSSFFTSFMGDFDAAIWQGLR